MTNLNSATITLHGVVYETTQFPAMRSFGLLARLAKVLGPAMVGMADMTGEEDVRALVPVLGAALANVSPQEAQSIVLELFSCTTAEIVEGHGARLENLGTQQAVDRVFSGKLGDMFHLLAHVMKVNYGDFFGGSDPAAGPAQAASGG